nr:ATP synthase F0 subunit 6 [Nemalecium lighti]
MSSYFDHFLILFYLPFTSNLIVVLIVIISVGWITKSLKELIPSRTKNIMIKLIDHWNSILKENIGKQSSLFTWPVFSLFIFLLLMNLLGFITHVFPITTLINVTFGLALIIWSSIIMYSMVNFKLNFFALLMPSGAPIILSPLLMIIEIISNFSRPIALGMRLAANLTAGHILMSILANFGVKIILASSSLISTLPIIIMISTTTLEVAVVFIQAYVFTLLTTIYLKEAIVIH